MKVNTYYMYGINTYLIYTFYSMFIGNIWK